MLSRDSSAPAWSTVRAELRLPELVLREPALVGEVVDGEHGRGLRERRAGLQRVAGRRGRAPSASRARGRLSGVKSRESREDSAPRERSVIAREVVAEVAVLVAVDAVAIVERVVLEEVDPRRAPRDLSSRAVPDAAPAPRPGRRAPRAARGGARRVLLGDAVARQHDAHVVAALGERERERAGDVGETAGLREGHALGDDEEDLETRHGRWGTGLALCALARGPTPLTTRVFGIAHDSHDALDRALEPERGGVDHVPPRARRERGARGAAPRSSFMASERFAIGPRIALRRDAARSDPRGFALSHTSWPRGARQPRRSRGR